MRSLLVLILWQLSFVSYAARMQTERASGLELKILPEVCQVRFTTGFVGPNVKWRKILGKDYQHVHHYCSGLVFLNRAKKRDEHRNFYLQSAQSELQYTIVHLVNPNYVLLPDIYYQMGVGMKHRGKIDAAISYANKSIQSKKQYLRPYLLLADIYIKAGNKEQAEDILLEAKKYYPKSKGIKRRLKKLNDKQIREINIKKVNKSLLVFVIEFYNR